jgi:ABC-type sugar transport system ATPase subunit
MPILQFQAIGKSFGSNRVLDAVSFDLREGEVHALAGENGAGKSTLIKILAGIHTEYDGVIELRGEPVRFSCPQDAGEHGISVIHQEMSLVNSMGVADNIFLGREPSRMGRLWLDRPEQMRRCAELCRRLDMGLSDEDLLRPVGGLPLSTRNRIEIAKALAFDARILVMDEPTSALDRPEVDRLFEVIASLRRAGCCVVYISHKMEEIYRIADRITVLRDGRWVGTAEARDCPAPKLIQWMIGRELSEQFPAAIRPPEDGTRLEIRKLRVPSPAPGRPDSIRGFSLSLRRGEIVGIAGLQGSGASELFQGLFGALGSLPPAAIQIDGEDFRPQSPAHSIRRGLAYLTADRAGTGLVPGLSVGRNMSLASLRRLSPGGVLRLARERREAGEHAERLHIRLSSVDQPVETLSGGNQQKVVLAKWLGTAPKVLLLEDPTRGVDVGSKREIYSLMRRWTAEGMAILLISSELPELLGLSDRILVLHRGEVTGEFSKDDATQERILAAAIKGS